MEKITKIIYKTIKVLMYLVISPIILLSIIIYWLMIDDEHHVPFYQIFIWFFELSKDIITGNVHDFYNDLEENSND